MLARRAGIREGKIHVLWIQQSLSKIWRETKAEAGRGTVPKRCPSDEEIVYLLRDSPHSATCSRRS